MILRYGRYKFQQGYGFKVFIFKNFYTFVNFVVVVDPKEKLRRIKGKQDKITWNLWSKIQIILQNSWLITFWGNILLLQLTFQKSSMEIIHMNLFCLSILYVLCVSADISIKVLNKTRKTSDPHLLRIVTVLTYYNTPVAQDTGVRTLLPGVSPVSGVITTTRVVTNVTPGPWCLVKFISIWIKLDSVVMFVTSHCSSHDYLTSSHILQVTIDIIIIIIVYSYLKRRLLNNKKVDIILHKIANDLITICLCSNVGC